MVSRDPSFSRARIRAARSSWSVATTIALAARLGQGLDHVRVDIYDAGTCFWIGELTLYSWSGYSRFVPDEADFELGSYWRIPSPGWRSIIAELFREPAFSPRRGALTVTPSAANVAS